MREQRHRVLVWSGDSAFAQRVSRALRPLWSEGLCVRASGDAEEVMAQILDDQADLLIADLGEGSRRMVVGLRNCKRVRPRLPVVVFTSAFNEQFGVEVLSLGIHYYLARDFEAPELIESVRSALGLSSAPPVA